jgi:hypothetical protein
MQLGLDAGEPIVEIDNLAEEQVKARVEFVIEVGKSILQVGEPSIHVSETALYIVEPILDPIVHRGHARVQVGKAAIIQKNPNKHGNNHWHVGKRHDENLIMIHSLPRVYRNGDSTLG